MQDLHTCCGDWIRRQSVACLQASLQATDWGCRLHRCRLHALILTASIDNLQIKEMTLDVGLHANEGHHAVTTAAATRLAAPLVDEATDLPRWMQTRWGSWVQLTVFLLSWVLTSTDRGIVSSSSVNGVPGGDVGIMVRHSLAAATTPAL